MIITFYSYKGGVGRSMALANVARWLQLQGLRVIVIDWDLEAPGVESFFTLDPAEREALRAKLGLIDMLVAYQDIFASLPIPEPAAGTVLARTPTSLAEGIRSTPEPRPADRQADIARRQRLEQVVETLTDALPPLAHVLAPIKSADGEAPQGTLSLLPAGSRSGARFPAYAAKVQEFDWAEFYASYEGEAYIEWLRRQLLDPTLADVVLIDSRTGVAEMNGACTRQMADVIVMLCAPNDQNLEGAARMASSFTRPGVIAARGQRSIELIMVPARVDVSEGRPVDLFDSSFRATFEPFTPPMFRALKVGFSKLRIPYISAYAYSERLAIGDPQGARTLQEAYVTLAAHMAALAPPDSRFKRACLKAIQETFGLPTVLVVELTPDVGPLAADVRTRLDGAGAMTILSTQPESVIDPLMQRGGPGGGSVPVVVPVTAASVADVRFRDLCRRSRQQGLCVTLATTSGLSPDRLARWARRLPVFDAESHLDELLTAVLTPCRMQRSPFLAPPPPPMFVGRDKDLAQVCKSLLERAPRYRGGSVALVGLGGIGKSALAAAVCHDDNVIDAFDDGILWATLGVAPNLLDVYSRLIGSFSAESMTLATVDEARRVLTEILSTKRCLLVLDDVWDASQAVMPPANSDSRLVITTRALDVASELGGTVFSMLALGPEDARALLSADLPAVDSRAVGDLAGALGGLPLALQLANRAIRTRIEMGDAPDAAISTFAAELANEGLTALDGDSSPEPGRSVLASLRLSAERLNAADRARLPSFAEIPPGVPVPIDTVAGLLHLGMNEVEPIVRRLASASLLTLDTAGRTVIVPSLAVEFFKTLQIRKRQEETTFTSRPASLPSIFLSYRREGSGGAAQRIADRLSRYFGYESVFFDAVSIAPGEDFRAQIERVVSACRVVIALIDRAWATELRPDDLVGLEITTAIAHGIPVIPVLVDGARMPSPSELAPELRALAFRQALVLDSYEFQTGIDRLIRSIEHIQTSPQVLQAAAPAMSRASRAAAPLPPSAASLPGSAEYGPIRRRQTGVAIAVGLLLIVGGGASFVLWRSPSAQSPSEQSPSVTPPAARLEQRPTAAGSSEAQALFSQAEDLYFGRSGPRDIPKAIALYRRAADLGSSSAMNSLGRMYENGQGVQQNNSEALRWYQRAAEAGHPDAIASVTRLRPQSSPRR